MKINYKSVLNAYVDDQIPKLRTVNNTDLESMFEKFSPDEIIKESEMTATELIETFRLSLITESLTEQYSETYLIGAKLHDADWLRNYVLGFWEPDENGHADPFKNILIDFGISQSTLDKEISEAKESVQYSTKHSSGLHPIALTTYGMIQECITDHWYELQRDFFPSASNTSKVISKVKGREALHTVQFRNLTAMQLEADPSLFTEIIKATINFEMPSSHIPTIVNLQEKTTGWIPRMNGDVTELLRRIIDNISKTLEDNNKLGQLLVEYATAGEKQFLRLVPNSVIKKALASIKGGHGIIGEIVLEQLGLVSNESESPKNFQEDITYRLRKVIKRWITSTMEIEGFLNGQPTNTKFA
tara:strand:+ start:516 stop:1592 length:1077 start_codon:yes stop_codon:yes gene_type:complete